MNDVLNAIHASRAAEPFGRFFKRLALFAAVLTCVFFVFCIFSRSAHAAVELFTTTGTSTWIAPANVFSVTVEVWGAGGGSGGGTNTGLPGGSGGGGGAYAQKTLTVIPGNSYTYFVGTGGPADSGKGGDSLFNGESGQQVLACGGDSGAANGGTAGLGGTATCSDGTTEFKGGDGAAGSGTVGGGGGEAATTTAAGNNASGQTGGTGTTGTDGSAGQAAGSDGVAGNNPGAGAGGSGRRSGGPEAGAAGGNGQVMLTYTPDTSILLTGSLYSDEGSTLITSGKTIVAAVGTSTVSLHATSSRADGTWGIRLPTGQTVATSTPIVIWVDGDAVKATLFTKHADGNSGTVSGLNLYQNRVIIRHEATSGTSTTNANMSFYDGDDDPDIQYTSNAGAYSQRAGNELHLWPGTTYIPGGTVTLHGNAGSGIDGDLHMPYGIGTGGSATSSSFQAGSNNVTLAGSWYASSSAIFGFSGAQTVEFNATTTGKSVIATSTPFNWLSFNGAGGAWTFGAHAATSTLGFSIDAGTVTFPSSTFTSQGTSFANSGGTITHNGGTVIFAGSNSISGTLTGTSALSNVIFRGGGSKSFSSNASTTNFTIESGSNITAHSHLTISGNYTNSGTYTASTSGTTTLSGGSQQTLSGTMTGSSAFSNLTITNISGTGDGSQSIIFSAAASTTGTLTMLASTSARFLASASSTFTNIDLQGASGQYVYLRSSSPGTRYSFYVPGTVKQANYVDVADASACPGSITAYSSIGSNTNCWVFPTPIQLSGTLYSDEGQTAITTGKTIGIAVGTSTPSVHTTTSNGSGLWSFTLDAFHQVGISTPIVAWVDGDAVKATTFTKASSTVNNISQIDLYQSRVILKHEGFTGTSTTNANLAFYDGDDDSDIMYTSNAGAYSQRAGMELHLAPGTSYIPGGTVTLNGNAGTSIDGDLHLPYGLRQDGTATSSSLQMAANNLTLAGSWYASSSAGLDITSGNVTFNSTSTAQKLVIATSTPFSNLIFQGTNGSWTFGNNEATSTSSFAINAGTLTSPSTYLNLGGGFSNNSSFIHNSGTVVFYRTTTSQTITSLMIGSNSFNNIVFRGAGTKIFGNVAASTTNLTIEATSGAVTFPSSALTIAGNFTNSSTTGGFAHNGGTVYFSSTSAQTISGTMTGNSPFATTTFIGAGTKTFANNASTTSGFDINAGATVVAPASFTIGGNYTQNGSFTDNSGTVFFSSSTNQTISGTLNTPTTDFASVVFQNGSTKTFSNNASTTHLTIDTGATVVMPSFLSISGNYTNNGTSTMGGGTVLLSGGLSYLTSLEGDGSSNGTLGSGTFAVAVSGNYAYVGNATDATACTQSAGSADGCELQVYNISDPSRPVYVAGRDADGSSNGTLGPSIRSLAVSGNYLYVGKLTDATACSQSAGSADGCEFMVFDISTPSSPTYVAGLDADGSSNGNQGPSIRRIVVSGGYAYVTKEMDATACSQSAGSADGCEFMVIDVSTPTSPTYVAGRDADGSSNGTLGSPHMYTVDISGSHAYVGKSFDSTGCASTPGEGDGCEFMVFDISSPTNPTYIAGLDSSGSNAGALGPSVEAVDVVGDYAYLGKGVDTTACAQSAGSADGCEFTVFDISSSTNPTFVAGLDSDGSTNGTLGTYILSLMVSGRYAYLGKVGDATACSQSAGSADGCEFMVVDVSDPQNPSYSAGFDADGSQTGTANRNMNVAFIWGASVLAGKAADATACAQTAGSAVGCEFMIFGNGNHLSGNMRGSSAFSDLTVVGRSVEFSGSASTTGMFTATNPYTTLTFEAGSTTSFTNMTVNGQASDSLVTLRSSWPGVQWNLTSTGMQTVDFVDVSDSNACGGDTIVAYESINSGNNTCWSIPSSLTLSGTLYSDEGVTPITSGKNVEIAIGTSTVSRHSVTTNGSGVWNFSLDTRHSVVPSTPILAWVDGDLSTPANVFTKASSSVNSISELNLFRRRVILKHEGFTGTSTTNTDLAFYDGNDDSDIQYTSNAGAYSQRKEMELHIAPGTTYAPGGSVTLHGNASTSDPDGDLHLAGGVRQDGVATSSVIQIGNSALSIAGNWFASSTSLFTHTGQVTTFTSTSTQPKSIIATSSEFASVTFDGVGGSWTFGSHGATTSTGFAFTITNGTVTAPSTNLALGGNLSNSGSFNHNGGTVILYRPGGSHSISTAMTGSNALNNVIFRGGGGTKSFSAAASTTNLTLEAGTVNLPSSALTVSGNYTNNATLSHNGGTVYFSSTSAQTISGTMTGNSAFATTTFIGSGTKTFANNASTTNHFTIESGATVVAPASLTIGGNYTNNGSFTDNSGTVFFSSSTNQTISGTLSTSTTDFANTEFLGSGTKTFANNASTTGFTIGSGVTVVAPSLLSISGNYSNSGTFTPGSGTTTFNGGLAQTIAGTLTGTSGFNHVAFSGGGTKAFSNNASTSNFTIISGSGAVTAPSVLTIGGDYANAATFTHNSGTVYASSSAAQTFSGTMTGTSAFNHLQFSGSGSKTFLSNASTSNFTLDTISTVVAPSLLSVSGNYTNNGTFTAGSGTTTFNGTSQQTLSGNLTGSSAFNNLEIRNTSGAGSSSQSVIFSGAASTTDTFTMHASTSARFLANSTSTFENLALRGSSGSPVYLRSSSPGTRFVFNVPGIERQVTYVDVQDSRACPYTILANDGTSIDRGNNLCWQFPAATQISSAANQLFTYQGATTTMSTITLTDGLTAAITAANDIRIVIATTSANMRWDTTDTTATFGGTASGKVSNPVSYLGGGEMLLIPVDTDFDASDTLTISGLSYAQFGSVNGAANALGVRVDGAGTTTSAQDDKTVTIKGSMTLTDHTTDQVDDNFDFVSDTNVPLYAFNITPNGESANISSLVLRLANVNNVLSPDITNLLLYRDTNNSKTLDGSDVQVGGSGALDITGRTGTLTFSTAFNATTTRDYLLVGDYDNVYAGDAMQLSLSTSDVTSSGLTSLVSLTTDGSAEDITHRKGGQAAGGGSSEIGGSAPQGGGNQGGGGGGGGQGEIGGDSGDTLGSEPGFNPPTQSGSPLNQWTNGTNALVSDGVWATAASSLSQSYGNFGFGVPGGNQIMGIEVKFEAHATSAAGTISVRLSWDGGSSVTSLKTTGTLTTSDVVYSLGGPSDLWGRTWSAAEFNNGNFTIEVVANPSSNLIRVDVIQVRVYHQTGGGGGGGGGGEVSIPSGKHFANVWSAFGTFTFNFWSVAGAVLVASGLLMFGIGEVMIYRRKRIESGKSILYEL